MSGFGIGEITALFFAIAICLGLVIAWILRSEANRTILRGDVRKLKERLDNAEREKVMLIEDMDKLKDFAVASESADVSGPDEGGKKAGPNKMVLKRMVEKNEALEREIEALKAELDEAKGSLEEVYKALVQ